MWLWIRSSGILMEDEGLHIVVDEVCLWWLMDDVVVVFVEVVVGWILWI